MSAEARYFRVGLFVLLGIAAAGSCTVVLGGGQLFRRTMHVETYFAESVQGLQVGSPLMVRGVQLGQVAYINFLDNVYHFETQEERDRYGQWIYVRMEVTPTQEAELDMTVEQREENLRTCLEEGFRLRLNTQALTGTSFIQGDFVDPTRNPPLEITWDPVNLYVPSAPSTMKTITTAAERIFQKLEQAKIDEVVNNLDTLLVTLNDRVAALDVEGFQGEGKQLLAEMRASLREADVEGLSTSARQTLEDANAAIVRLQHVTEGSRYDLQIALENLRVTTENLRELSETAKTYPSLMILGEPPPRSKEIQ